ncbi:hypothetical protein [Hymenobacter tenuis]
MLNVGEDPATSRSLALSIADKQSGLTPALARQSPQVSALRRAAPGDAAEALANLLTFTAHLFNVVRNLSEVQITLLAQDLMERYWHWKFDEFIYVFREATAGRWGKVYDRLDAGTVHEWCKAYEIEVQQPLLEKQALNESAKFKQLEQGAALNENMNRVYTKHALLTRTNEELEAGIDYYWRHLDAPGADMKIELANEILEERAAAAKRAAERLEEQRAKARAMIGEYDAATLPTPDLESEAARHFAAVKAIPKPSDILKPATMQVVKDTNAA